MLNSWNLLVLLQATSQINAVVWVPIGISLSGVLVVIIINSIFVGRAFEKKADKCDTVSRIEHEKDIIQVNKDLDSIERKAEAVFSLYHSINERLGRMDENLTRLVKRAEKDDD